MTRLSTLLGVAFAAALSVSRLALAEPAPAEDARPPSPAGETDASGAPLGRSVSAHAATESAIEPEIAAAPGDTVEVVRYATLAEAIAATVTEEAKLTASDAATNDFFGLSVSLSGDRALIGAPSDNSTGPGSTFGFGRGAAYLFAFDGAAWSQQAKLTSSDAAPDRNFGVTVSLGGDRALVADNLDDTVAGSDAGSAYVFNLGPGASLVADAGPDQTVVAGQTVTLDGTGSAGIEPLDYAWTLSGGATLAGADTATPSFCAAAPGTYTAGLTVTDVNGASASDAATVTAQSPSAALVAIAGGASAATALNPAQKVALVAELKKAQRALARGLSPAPFLASFRSQVQGLQAQGRADGGDEPVLPDRRAGDGLGDGGGLRVVGVAEPVGGAHDGGVLGRDGGRGAALGRRRTRKGGGGAGGGRRQAGAARGGAEC